MVPVLFSGEVLGVPVEVRAYGTFLVLAAVVSLAVGVAGARRAGFPPGRIAAIYLGAIVAGLAGARFLDVALQQDAYAAAPQAAAALAPRGFALYGGLGAAIVIVATAIAVGARRGMPAPGVTAAAAFGRLADSAVPAVVAGIVLLRIGCFLNGCCTGVATDLPVGMAFPAGPSAATSFLGIETAEAPVHPTQLYEMAAAVLCGLGALWAARTLSRVGTTPGAAALLFTTGFLAFRAANQVLRTPDLAGEGPLLPAAYLCGAALAAAWAAVVLLRSRTASHAASARAREVRRSTILSG